MEQIGMSSRLVFSLDRSASGRASRLSAWMEGISAYRVDVLDSDSGPGRRSRDARPRNPRCLLGGNRCTQVAPEPSFAILLIWFPLENRPKSCFQLGLIESVVIVVTAHPFGGFGFGHRDLGHILDSDWLFSSRAGLPLTQALWTI